MIADDPAEVEPRAYRMVRFLERELDPTRLPEPRVMNLPALLQRNGLLQVAVFLQAKGKGDEALRLVLEKTIRASLGVSPCRPGGAGESVPRRVGLDDTPKESRSSIDESLSLTPTYLAECSLAVTLLLEELAVEAAVWLRRLYEVKHAATDGATPKVDPSSTSGTP